MATILVTGGCGFIGSNLIPNLLQNHKIIIIDNFNDFYAPELKEKNWFYLKEIQNQCHPTNDLTLIKGDILQLNDLKMIHKIKPVDLIIHLAAQPGVRDSIRNPMKYNRQNVEGTKKILKFAVTRNIKKIINFSSSAVYGNQDIYPLTEILEPKPISPYGKSKLQAEYLCEDCSIDYGLTIYSLRPFSVYGPRQRPDMAINIFTKNIIEKKTVPIFGDGLKLRDFTYVSDVLSAVLRCITVDLSPKHHIFNLGFGYPVSVQELVKKIGILLKIKPNIRYYKNAESDVEKTFASMEKIKKMMNFIPHVSIDEGLAMYIDWIKGSCIDF